MRTRVLILKEAWEKRNEALNKAYIFSKGTNPRDRGWPDTCAKINEANDLYTTAAKGFFGPGYVIYWDSGYVKGKILPIPFTEVGL